MQRGLSLSLSLSRSICAWYVCSARERKRKKRESVIQVDDGARLRDGRCIPEWLKGLRVCVLVGILALVEVLCVCVGVCVFSMLFLAQLANVLPPALIISVCRRSLSS
jgi:hypothetical protein